MQAQPKDTHSLTARWRRICRHLWLDASDSHRLLPADACAQLEAAVRDSEARHLGELRLCVEAALPWDALRAGMDARQRAIDLFGRLRVWDTEHNNGVLIYLLLADRRIEVLADRGLHQRVAPGEWDRLTQSLAQALADGNVQAGLMQALQQVSALLIAHHPAPDQAPRRNELPDAVVLM